MTVYAVSLLAQKEQVEELCFKKCGHVIVGGLEIAGAPFLPCRTSPCPYLEREISLGEAGFDWGKEEVIVRKLKSGKT